MSKIENSIFQTRVVFALLMAGKKILAIKLIKDHYGCSLVDAKTLVDLFDKKDII